METFIPKYIYQTLDYRSKEVVTNDEYNNIHNLLIQATDHNTTVLDSIFNDPETKLVINATNAEYAEHASTADNSTLFNGASLSKSTEGHVKDNDNTVPSSKQVFETFNGYDIAYRERFTNIEDGITDILNKNLAQDNRLSQIDSTLASNNTRLGLLEGKVSANENSIINIRNVDLGQNSTLAQHDQRLTNLEIGNIPEDVVKTLMTKGGYAVDTGMLDPEGMPIYSADTVKTAQTAHTILIDGAQVPGNIFAKATDVAALYEESFVQRGTLAAPANSDYYVSEMRALKHGSYEVSVVNAEALNAGPAAGTLRSYPCNNGTSLEFEVQGGVHTGRFYTMFISNSTPASTSMATLTWTDDQKNLQDAMADISTLSSNKLASNNVLSGDDINIVTANNNVTVNYTGPIIKAQATQPTADPNRVTIWIETSN